MKDQSRWYPQRGTPVTIWSKAAEEFLPERFRRIILWVMPPIYGLLTLFGITAALVPVPTFKMLIGTQFGITWALVVGCSAFVSLVGLVFRLQIEIYSSIILAVFLFIYPFYIGYIVFHDTTALQDSSRLGIIFAVALYPIMPGWRVIDIVLELRKSRQRQLYALSALGEAPNDTAT